MRRWLRLVRGTLGNALVWATAWLLGGVAWLALQHLVLGDWELETFWRLISVVVDQLLVAGFATGAAISAVLRLTYSGRALLEIRLVPFALLGAALAGVSAVAYEMARLDMPVLETSGFLEQTVLISCAFGALTAAGTLRIAQQATRRLDKDAVDALAPEQEGVVALPSDESARH